MPAPQAQMMQNFAKLQFQSFGIKLPKDWKQPMGEAADQFRKALSPSDRQGVMTPMPPALFLPATTIKIHCETADKISKCFSNYIDGICSAICSAWAQWQATATLSNVVIMGPVATMGTVAGPPLLPIILGQGPMSSPMEMKYTNAIATAISNGWLAYTSSITVPGLPWYPLFASFAGPFAPPMPNVPCPLSGLTQVPVPITKDILKQQMVGLYGDPTAPHSMELFDCIADAFDKCFKVWQGSTMVNNVMGTGPVPTFAPPVVPVGPVMGGLGNMIPGGFT